MSLEQNNNEGRGEEAAPSPAVVCRVTGAGRWVSPVLSAAVAWHGAACIAIRAESLAACVADSTPRTPSALAPEPQE